MSNYTPEQVQECVVMAEQNWPGSHIAGMLRDYATLHQQAGRVDEGMVERAFRSLYCPDGEHITRDDVRAALTSALAQNTQGEAEGIAEIYDALPHCSERTTFTFTRDKLQALLLHAERARVPADELVGRAYRRWYAAAKGFRNVVADAAHDLIMEEAKRLAAAPSQRAEVK